MRVALGSDHAGFGLKGAVSDQLRSLGHETHDLGTHDGEPSDYPDLAGLVAHEVACGAAQCGILACGTGIGMAIAANKVPGIRAAVCRTGFEARMARRHNDANVLCLGERVTGPGVAAEVVAAFIEESFEGGRHARRLDKIRALETPAGAFREAEP
jgi:ribose 5-phosphate isomerase B